jgi:hypothetical protein
MTRCRASPWAIASLLGVASCQFQARSPEEYRKDTRAVLAARTADIRSCYDDALKINPNATGNVVVRFVVARQTGVVTGAEILPQTTAPAPVPECIRLAMYGLALQPPDARDGEATFVWTFHGT